MWMHGCTTNNIGVHICGCVAAPPRAPVLQQPVFFPVPSYFAMASLRGTFSEHSWNIVRRGWRSQHVSQLNMHKIMPGRVLGQGQALAAKIELDVHADPALVPHANDQLTAPGTCHARSSLLRPPLSTGGLAFSTSSFNSGTGLLARTLRQGG
jgi:hypothetical protein